MTKTLAEGLMSSTPFVDEAEVPVELLPAEAVDGHDRAVLDELPRRSLLYLFLQADGAICLHGALVDERGARVDRGAAMALEDERGHAVMPEKDRSRQSDEAAADDENGNVFVLHGPGQSWHTLALRGRSYVTFSSIRTPFGSLRNIWRIAASGTSFVDRFYVGGFEASGDIVVPFGGERDVVDRRPGRREPDARRVCLVRRAIGNVKTGNAVQVQPVPGKR